MPKQSKDSGSRIDFANLSPDDLDRMKKAVKVVAEYIGQQKQTAEAIKETLQSLVDNMGADKDSSKRAKRYVRIAARAYIAESSDAIVEDHTAIEQLLKALGELK